LFIFINKYKLKKQCKGSFYVICKLSENIGITLKYLAWWACWPRPRQDSPCSWHVTSGHNGRTWPPSHSPCTPRHTRDTATDCGRRRTPYSCSSTRTCVLPCHLGSWSRSAHTCWYILALISNWLTLTL
jgi:hypothetical protein